VVVTARVHDLDGVAALRLIYRNDPLTTTASLTMVDDGTAGDAIAVMGFTAPPFLDGP